MVSIKRIAIKKFFNLFITVALTEIIQIGTIKVVSKINKIDIPSIPTL